MVKVLVYDGLWELNGARADGWDGRTIPLRLYGYSTEKPNHCFQVFSLVALIIFLEMIGIFYGNVFFWVTTLTIYMMGMILVCFVLYFSHAIEPDEEDVRVRVGNSVWKLNLRTIVRYDVN